MKAKSIYLVHILNFCLVATIFLLIRLIINNLSIIRKIENISETDVSSSNFKAFMLMQAYSVSVLKIGIVFFAILSLSFLFFLLSKTKYSVLCFLFIFYPAFLHSLIHFFKLASNLKKLNYTNLEVLKFCWSSLILITMGLYMLYCFILNKSFRNKYKINTKTLLIPLFGFAIYFLLLDFFYDILMLG